MPGCRAIRKNSLKIFILKPSSLGDVVQALPVLRLLKKHFPASTIYWWIEASLSPLLENDPDLAGLVRFDRHRWASPERWSEGLQSLKRLREEAFDLVIDLQALARSSVVSWLVHGRLTVGLDDAREGAPAFYDLRVPRLSPLTHAVDWYLGVLRALAVPVGRDFDWLPARPDVQTAIRQRWSLDAMPFIAFQPGARWTTKRWPAEHFATLIRSLAVELPDHRFVLLGSAADADLARTIAAVAPGRCLSLAGRTSLPEMVECLRLSELLVTNDSGPMHVAAALGRPVVGLFGPTEPRRTGPYGQVERALQMRLPCVPCLRGHCRHTPPLECLTALPPDRVRRAVLDRLAGEPPVNAACQRVLLT